MKLYLGTSGWQYYHWQGNFYPQGLKSKNFLKFYSQHFNTVEVNTTFYHFTKKSTFKNWLNQVPRNFLFSLKLHRLFTHFRRLRLNSNDQILIKQTIKNYQTLGRNLKVVLIQLPPSLKEDLSLLQNFCQQLRPKNKRSLRFAIEFRHSSWLNENVYRILKKNEIAFVISDSPRWPTDIIKTTDFIYIRFHGKPKLFASLYSQKELKEWIAKLKNLKPRQMYVYFNNDFEGYAIKNAFEFRQLVNF